MDQTIGEVLAIPGFGARCLVDLLTSIESTSSSELGVRPARVLAEFEQVAPAEAKLDRQLTEAARRIRDARFARFAGAIRRDDIRLGPLFGDLLQALFRPLNISIALRQYPLRDIADRVVKRNSDPKSPAKILQALEELDKKIHTLAGMKLEDELMDIVRATRGERDARIAVAQFGWDGAGGKTLQSVGDEVGLSRERIRQICDRVIRRLRGKKPFAPALDLALALVERNLPEAKGEIEWMLASEGISRQAFRLRGLVHAAEILGRGSPIDLVATNHLTALVGQVAKKTVEHWGVATVADVTAQVEHVRNKSTNPAFVAAVLQGLADFHWLDKESGWFWLSSVKRNRLANQIRKILSVTGSTGITELRSGVGRHHRMKGFAPPGRVLLEFARQALGYRIDGNVVMADPQPDWEITLSGVERTMARVLKSHGPLMERAKFEQMCLEFGIKRSTFYIYLDYSPIIQKYGRGVYGLRGSQVAPGVVESLMTERQRRRVLLDYGWTQDGMIWLGYSLSDALLLSGVVSIPASMKRFIAGQFTLLTADGSSVGTLSTKESTAWGLGPFFRRRGGDPGDHLLILIDTKNRKAIAHIGDKELLEDLSLDATKVDVSEAPERRLVK